MAFENDAQRIEALTQASNVDPVAPEPAPAPVEQAPVEQQITPPVESGTTETPVVEDSYRGFDASLLAQLPPSVQAAVEAERKSIQGEATKRFQEAAELRKQFDGLDPEIARQSVQYVEGLADPAFLLEAHAAMSAHLESLGLTKAQADQQAAQQVLQDVDDYEDEGTIPPQYAQQLTELQTKVERFEQAQLQTNLMNETLKQETLIRQQHPTYTDDDVAFVMRLGWATGGNLLQADTEYQNILNHAAKTLLSNKASIPSAISPPAPGTNGAEPFKPETDMAKAHENAKARLRMLSE